MAALSLQQTSLQELLATLKDGRGAQKVAEWHAKIDGLRLDELKQRRNNSKLQQQVFFLLSSFFSLLSALNLLSATHYNIFRSYSRNS